MSVWEELKQLTGKDLKGFQILLMAEVYKKNEDGRKTGSVGFFKNPAIAQAFVGEQNDAPWHGIAGVYVLTNGKVGYVLDTGEKVTFFDDEQEAVRLRQKILEKLTPGQRALLGV
ncbi:MAG: hypothetical protein UT86_C0004G0074 [Candidatus Magasanikbacteria bacterium GW2011_GWC2_40_17]|uniref:Uncharacterized protein n=1 Tax=Candidatus Magasanikbacteria bacterium GW2011_GWA2_42_32 TaxID=1619039 RepID=A0A0G1A7W3_9BACT|nr:MAG: hypothetical protein UT86_C0004G0074 [Candidatus Magasanikbacteria bacterium GW2011_GWC2_40_17]KKS57132.1 MAG: hypothetical protein UV20_C0003G0074 [Candidatus Magasanikbacteria bacterium GW2011_GWA2_42_32]OGH85348.1 MAG: hypothetical protein A2294_01080 [Candidatus Magasanikbacteria bacterium RIFOXYB2_FULL_38_10]